MNYHTDEWIMEKVKEHYNEALQYFPENQIVGIFLQGSQNYGLDTPNSDIDTKLVVLPSLEDIALNKKAVSTTHIRENDEHIDFKDLRLMLQTFKKQNLNFLEILFTKYKIVNPTYEYEWNILVNNAELISRYHPLTAVKSMKGIAMEKYHAMEHRYPSKIEVIDKYGYDPKQLHHLVRVVEWMERYINDEAYIDCLYPKKADFIKDLKSNPLNLQDARKMADNYLQILDKIYANASEKYANIEPREDVNNLLETVQYSIIKQSIKEELNL